MKTIKLKSTKDNPRWTLQHPQAETGWDKDHRVLTIAIENVPDEIEASEVILKANSAGLWGITCHEDYSDLKPGNIIK